MAHLTNGGDIYLVGACYVGRHSLQDWAISQVSLNVEHATVLPPAKHIAVEIWEMASYGMVKDAIGYEMVPLWGRRYDPLTRHSGDTIRRYALRVTAAQIRTVRHLCETRMVGKPYDLVALVEALHYERSHPRQPGRRATGGHGAFDCCAAFTAILRAAGVPVLADWLVGTPPMVLPPRATTPSACETWLSRNADPFEHILAA